MKPSRNERDAWISAMELSCNVQDTRIGLMKPSRNVRDARIRRRRPSRNVQEWLITLRNVRVRLRSRIERLDSEANGGTMICPQCQGEFVPGIEVCNDCGIPLVEPPPDEEEYLESEQPFEELVTVLESGDPGLLAIATSLLDEEGILYSAGSETVQDLFGVGRMGSFNFNFILGPVPIRVRASDAELARELLREIDASATPPTESELQPDDT